MSSTYSAASAASLSDSSVQECASSPSARSTDTRAPCSLDTGRECRATETFESSQQTDLFATDSEASTSSAAASRVRTYRSPEKAQDSPARAPDCGANSRALLARFDRATSSWRTPQRCLVEGWAKYSETWPRSGLMRSGTAYQLPPLARRISATGSGLLPTPTGMGGGGSSRSGERIDETPTLEGMARKGLLDTWRPRWPTPTAGDAKASGSRNTANSRAHPGISLTDAVRADGGTGRRWATPTARDHRHPNARPFSQRGGGSRGEQLPNQIGGPLNPTWVEWLMGYPEGWTVCDASEARSSRSSRK